MPRVKAVFIDRDGTMGADSNIEFPWTYRPLPDTAAAFALLRESGYTPMVFTNQSCIARGKDDGYDFAAEFRGIGAADWFICPHDDGDDCDCRKPKPGLLLQAKEKYDLDLTDCVVIGDRWSDMAAGGAVGCRLILVTTGRGKEALTVDRAKWVAYEPDLVADDLYRAALWLAEQAKDRA